MHMFMHDCEYSFPAVLFVLVVHECISSSFAMQAVMDAAEIILQALCTIIQFALLLQPGLD